MGGGGARGRPCIECAGVSHARLRTRGDTDHAAAGLHELVNGACRVACWPSRFRRDRPGDARAANVEVGPRQPAFKQALCHTTAAVPVDPRTQDYYERRIKDGKTRREIVRCLKRYAAREVFRLVRQLQSGPRS
ncbi:hypothetical protein SAMN05446589_1564 [Streptomyces sp. OV198]|nr:hypothetical protein SAMN05446589_1564 [Streptomyces sp. OV198]